MALTGNLQDMKLIDLIQFPYGGRKTGRLRITSPKGKVELYYQEGALVHADMGETTGFEVLVDIIDWAEGEFEFHPLKRLPAARTLSGDLHHIVMRALKTHDERKEEMRQMASKKTSKPADAPDLMARRIADYVRSQNHVRYACALAANGRIITEAQSGSGNSDGLQEVIAAIHQTITDYPRGGINRLLLCDEHDAIIGERLDGETTLLVAADPSAPLGAIFMSVGKLATTLSGAAR